MTRPRGEILGVSLKYFEYSQYCNEAILIIIAPSCVMDYRSIALSRSNKTGPQITYWRTVRAVVSANIGNPA